MQAPILDQLFGTFSLQVSVDIKEGNYKLNYANL